MEHTVLVVEDEKGIREAIGIYMKNQGYHVILAKNGKEGLEKIHELLQPLQFKVLFP